VARLIARPSAKPSIDQVAAGIIGKTSKYKSIRGRISTRIKLSEGDSLRYLSHSGPDSPTARVRSGEGLRPPVRASDSPHRRPRQAGGRRDAAYRKSVLDACLTDLTRCARARGAADRARLDKHADGVRSNRKSAWSTPRQRPDLRVLQSCPSSRAASPIRTAGEMSKKRPRRCDLLAMAMACDQTRVFSMMFSGSVASTVYWQSRPDGGHHQITHDEPGIQPAGAGLHGVHGQDVGRC